MSIQVVDYLSDDAAKNFEQSIRETGFGVLSQHPVDMQLVSEVYAMWEQFFASDEKHATAYTFDPATHSGFVPCDMSETAKGSRVKDIKEFFHYYHPWGRIPPALAAKTQQLCEELIALASILAQWLETNMPAEIRQGLTEHLSDMLKGSESHLFRLANYPALTGDEPADAIRAAAHEDIDFLTLLPAATSKGLQAKSRAGEWVDVPCDPSWIIINVGDMLQEATDGYYPSTSHRVINPEGEEMKKARMSMPLFLHPRDEVQLSSRHTAKSYREERYRELGLLDKDQEIKA